MSLFCFTLKVNGQCTPVIGTNPASAQGCETFTVQFSDNSACTIQQRQWNFGDGTTSSVQNPSHSFNAGLAGDTAYNVELKLQDVGGVWYSSFKVVTVYAKPKPTFSSNKTVACAIVDSILFTNTSPMPGGSTVSWDFGDGSALSSQNVVYHKYNTPGTYTVKLTVSNVNTCAKTVQSSVTINEIPNPDFTLSSVVGCNPLSVTFTNTTVSGTFPISSWSWDFGGLSSTTLQQPSPFVFLNSGTYPVGLTATNTAGCTNKTINNVFVNPTPTATFALPTKICKLDTASIVYTGTGNAGATYTWNFNSPLSASGSGQGPIDVVWNSSGNKTISLTVLQAGCTSSLSKNIYVAPLPAITLTTSDVNDSVCEAQTVVFTAIPDSFVTYQFYNLGVLQQDTYLNTFSISTLITPNLITAFATDTNGCASSASNAKNVTILPKPIVAISTVNDTICKGGSLSFTATPGYDSYVFLKGFLEVQNTSSNLFSSSTLEQDDKIKVFAVDGGCTGDLSNELSPVIISPLDKPQISCGKSTVNQVSFLWEDDVRASSFEISVDGGAYGSSLFRTEHIKGALTPGDTVWASVVAVGAPPCGNSLISDTIFCIAQPCDSVSFNFQKNYTACEGSDLNLAITNLTAPTGQYGISWNNGAFEKLTTYQLNVTSSVKIPVVVMDSSQINCPAVKKVIDITSNLIPLLNLTSTASYSCEFDNAVFNAGYAGYSNYRFFVNDTMKQDSSFHKFSTTKLYPGSNEIVVQAINSNCISYDTLDINVIQKPTVNFTVSSDSVCKGSLMTYTVNGNFDYYRFSRTGTSRLLQDTTLNVYQSKSENKVTIVATDANGCRSYSDNIVVYQKALPAVSFYPIPSVDSLCFGDSILLYCTPNQYDLYEFWDNFSLRQSSSNSSFKVADLQNDHSYYARVRNQGCYGKTTDTLRFKVREKLKQPVANCGLTGSGQMQFTWDAITSNTGYQVSVNGASFKVPSSGNSGLSHIVTGLAPLDTVCVRVIAKGNQPCGNSIASLPACCIMPCAPVTFDQNFTDKEICKGQSVTLQIKNIVSPSKNYLISWNGGTAGNIKSKKFTPLKDTVVAVSVWDITQIECSPTLKYFTIKVNELPTVTIDGDTTFCSTDQIVLTASPTYYDNYQFYDRYLPIASGLNPTQIDKNIQNGHFYTVVATYRGCKDTSDRHFIHVVPKLEVPDAYCGITTNSSIEIRWDAVALSTGYEISLDGFPYKTPSSGSTGLLNFTSGLTAGDSIVAIVRALGSTPCSVSEASKTITCYAKNCDLLNFKKSNDLQICAGDQVNLTVSNIQSPSSKYAISWDGGSTYSKTNSFSKKVYSDSIVRIVLLDSVQLGCPVNAKDVVINVQQIPSLKLISNAGNDSICQGDVLELQSDVIGYDGYKFYIDNVLAQDSLFHVYSTSTLSVGNHKIKVNSSYNACYFLSDSTIFNIVSFPQLKLKSSDANDSICAGDAIVFKANKGFESYAFYQNGVLKQNGVDSVFSTSGLASGDEVFCIGNNKNLCSRYSDTIATSVFPIPTITLTSSDLNNIICTHDTVQFTVSPTTDWFAIYNQTDSLKRLTGASFIMDTLQSSDVISVKGSIGGCTSFSNTIQTTAEYTPTAKMNFDTLSICVGDKINLKASGGKSYLWSNGSVDSLVQMSPANTSYIWVKTKVDNCTSWGDSLHVFVDQLKPAADAGFDEVICRYDSIQLAASGGLTYRWIAGDSISNTLISDPFVHPLTTTKFKVEVSNTVCRDTAEITVTVDKCLTELPTKIKEIFTPNKDNKNDFFVIDDIDYFTKNSFTVYNRWSNVVYQSAPYHNEWEGTNNSGANLPDGTYFIVLDLGNGKAPYTGFVMIQR
ncbi:MAG: PKD domain-containing protein [Bacteroidetes bacterium]|nr:PKD domain-containing protein [Bacteroidota bacterium]